MPTMKNKHKFQRTNAHYQGRLQTEMAECLALKKALKFSGINAIDIPCIEVIDIFSSLHDPVMRLQALLALEEGRLNIQPCIKMSFSKNWKRAKAVAKIYKKADLQKFFFSCSEFSIMVQVSNYHI